MFFSHLFYFHLYFLLDSFCCRNFTNCWYFNNLDIFLGIPCKESLWARVLYSAFIHEREFLPKKSRSSFGMGSVFIGEHPGITNSYWISSICMVGMNYWIHITKDSTICKTQQKNKAASEKTSQNAYVGAYLPHKYMWWSVSLESFVPQQSLECSCFVYWMFFLYAWVEQGNTQHKATNFPHLLLWQFIKPIWVMCLKTTINNDVSGLYFQ